MSERWTSAENNGCQDILEGREKEKRRVLRVYDVALLWIKLGGHKPEKNSVSGLWAIQILLGDDLPRLGLDSLENGQLRKDDQNYLAQ